MNLSHDENLVLRMLHSQRWTSDTLPATLLTVEIKDNLVGLGLLALAEGQYLLTELAMKVIEENSFIVKYPLATEKGIVSSYNNVLTQMSKPAIFGLGMAIVGTDSHKRWGKQVNTLLFEKLKESMAFYRTMNMHPLQVIELYKLDIREAELQYEAIVNSEFNKIDEIVSVYPSIKLYDTALKDSITLLQYVPVNTIIAKEAKGETITVDLSTYTHIKLDVETKASIVASYYSQKSRKNDSKKKA